MPDSQQGKVPEIPLGPLMVDVAGLSLSADEKDFLQLPSIGAVILFSRNFESKAQVSQLISEIKSVRHPALLIAVDQEGGRVQRFKKEFFTLPAVNKFGLLYETEPDRACQQSHIAGKLMAAELIEIGVDFSFAPVLDCANFQSSVIGDRGFHTDPKAICDLAGAFIDGMVSAGMSATGKHFPGHGGVIGDSHHELPVDQRSMQELAERDLLPFRHLANKLGGVMTAHVQYPEVVDELPTFSKYWINQILRQQMGFQGVVFSDDLSMKGAHGAGSPMQRTMMALDAGCDMALICNDPKNAQYVAQHLEVSYHCKPQQLSAIIAMAAKSSGSQTSTLVADLTKQLEVLG